jgi:hypothetical protein
MIKAAEKNGHLSFICPGCKSYHTIPVHGANAWTWNDSLTMPTLKPSILVNVNKSNPGVPVCHSFVTNGNIQFLNDSTHALAGQTVLLPEYE